MAAKTSRPARRTTPARTGPVAVPLADGVEPLRFTTPTEPVEEERVVVFFLDDVPYTMPAHVSPSVSLKFMKIARSDGMELAMAGLLEEVLGPEAYDALSNYKHLTQQNMGDLMDAIRRHAMGSLEGPKEGSKSA